MSLKEDSFDAYMCLLAHNIWRFPFWMEEREREKEKDNKKEVSI